MRPKAESTITHRNRERIIAIITHRLIFAHAHWTKHIKWYKIGRRKSDRPIWYPSSDFIGERNFANALEPWLLGQLFIFRTIFQPRALYSDIPAVGGGSFTLTLSLLKWPKQKNHQKFQISFRKILRDKQSYVNVLPKRFHLIGNTIGFCHQIKKLEWQIISP